MSVLVPRLHPFLFLIIILRVANVWRSAHRENSISSSIGDSSSSSSINSESTFRFPSRRRTHYVHQNKCAANGRATMTSKCKNTCTASVCMRLYVCVQSVDNRTASFRFGFNSASSSSSSRSSFFSTKRFILEAPKAETEQRKIKNTA